MHYDENPAAVEEGSQGIRLGAGGANHASPLYPPRVPSAQSDTLGPLLDCGGLFMVHVKMAAAVESFGLTEMLEPIPGTLISRRCAW